MNKFAYELGKQCAEKVAWGESPQEEILGGNLTMNALLGALVGAPAGAIAAPEGRGFAGAGVGALTGLGAGAIKPLLYDVLRHNQKNWGIPRASESLATIPLNTTLSALAARGLSPQKEKKGELLPESSSADAIDRLNRTRRLENMGNFAKYVVGGGLAGAAGGGALGYGVGSLAGSDHPGLAAGVGSVLGSYGGLGIGALLQYLNSKGLIDPMAIIPQSEINQAKV
jgi:uncharacterized membrane protein